MSDGNSVERKCYQCGVDLILVLPEDGSEDSWLVCDNCGERIVTVREFKEGIQQASEERIRKALGVDEWKPSGID